MAQSKNKRKNGKVIKKNDANVKRMRRMASYDLKDLILCNVVDRKEIDGDRSEMIPRTLIFNRKTNKVMPFVSPLQERALRTERWKWNIHSGVICRKPDGEVYLDKERNIFTQTEVLLTEMNDYVTDELTSAFKKANSLNALTMFWIATPYDMGDPLLQAVLAPLWRFNVLGNMLTKYEMERDDHVVIHYKADTLDEYLDWFLHQAKHKQELENLRTFTIWWEATGTKMQKGELVAYRKQLVEVGKIEQIGVNAEPFNPTATVKGFVGCGKRTFVDKGVAMSQLMTAMEKVPPCLNAFVGVKYIDGRENLIKFHH